MRPFAYERPRDLAGAMRLLSEHGAAARILAGGTDLVVGLRDDSIRAGVVVDIKGIAELHGPAMVSAERSITFGALTVMRDIEAHPDVLARLPALAEAARVVGSVQIRNRATLAGNLCNASPAADTTPPLLVYGASVVVRGPTGERRVPLDAFTEGPGRVALGPAELVSAVIVPVPPPDVGSAYVRLVRRRGTDLASVTLCASVDAAGHVRLAYGSVGPRAFLVADEQGILADPGASPAARAAVLDELLAQASPSPTSIRAGPTYRLAMLRVLALRAIETARARRQTEAA